MDVDKNSTDLPTLEILCFGPPTVRVGGQAADPRVMWRKNFALLAYLAMSRHHTRSREHLLGLLWPEKPDGKARHSLNEALRSLRATLGTGRFVSRGGFIELNGVNLTVDALDSEKARAPTGDFLDGFILDDAPAFEEWVSGERRRFRAVTAEALVSEGEILLAQNGFTEAEQAARRALDLLPHWEPAADLLIRTATLAGETAAALAAYEAFVTRLATDTGSEPSDQLRRLLSRIQSQGWRDAAARRAVDEPPLVGRPAEHAEIIRAATARTGTRCVVITGDPGLGKTRLVSECLSRFALHDGVTVLARPLESDRDTPWSTLGLLVRSGLAAAPGMAGADPHALSVLASLAPEIGRPSQAMAPKDSAHVASSLSSLVAAVAEEQPLAIAIDDAQYADAKTLEALGSTIKSVRPLPVLLVITVDGSTERPPRELVKLRGVIGRDIDGVDVTLGPIADDHLAELIEHLATWSKDPKQLDRLTRRLAFETGGNPFYAVTLLRGLAESDELKDELSTWPKPRSTMATPLPNRATDVLRTAIAARASNLDDESLDVLRAASVGDVALDVELIAGMLELSTDRVEELLDELERGDFVGYDNTRYTFSAPVIRDAVRIECLKRGARQRLGRRAAELLAARTDIQSRVLRAELIAVPELADSVFDELTAAARVALSEGSERTAQRAIAAADRAAGSNTKRQATVVELKKIHRPSFPG